MSSISPITYKSLTPLHRLLSRKSFKLQIISLEPFTLFVEYLKFCRIKFKLHFNLKLKDEAIEDSLLNIIIGNGKQINRTLSSLHLKKLGFRKKIILYSNVRNPDFVQIIFKPTEDEVFDYLKLKSKEIQEIKNDKDEKNHELGLNNTINNLALLTKMYYNHKTLYRLSNSLFKPKAPFFLKTLSYLESLLVFVLTNSRKFEQIMESVRKIDNITNSFQVMLCLNHLIKAKIVKKRGCSYCLNISREYVSFICKEIGYNIDML